MKLAPCSICHGPKQCNHFSLYVFGSEGVWLCHECEMAVHKFIRDLSLEKMRERRDSVKETE